MRSNMRVVAYGAAVATAVALAACGSEGTNEPPATSATTPSATTPSATPAPTTPAPATSPAVAPTGTGTEQAPQQGPASGTRPPQESVGPSVRAPGSGAPTQDNSGDPGEGPSGGDGGQGGGGMGG